MPDGVSFSLVSEPTVKAMRQISEEVQRANVVAVKAAGVALAAEARGRAPVYTGTRRDVPKGRLRRSIRPGRAFKIGTNAAGITVGPRGRRVRLYAGKEEARDPYMSPAEAATASTLAQIAAVAYAGAMAKAVR